MVIENYRERCRGSFGQEQPPHRLVEMTSRDRLADEFATARRRRPAGIILGGATINLTAARARALAAAYWAVFGRRPVPILHARWLPEGPFDPPVIALLRNVRDLEMDMQLACPAVRRLYRRRFTQAAYASTVNRLREDGVAPTFRIAVGVPGDTERDLLETFRRAYFLRPQRVRAERFYVEPDTFFDRHRERFQVSAEPVPPYTIESHRTANAFHIAWMHRVCSASAGSYNTWCRLAREERAKQSRPA